MRWSVTMAALGLLASGCREPTYLGGFYADGGVDGGFPVDPGSDDPAPPPDAGIRDVDELLERASSEADFSGVQGQAGWRYGYWEVVVGSGPTGTGGDVSDPGMPRTAPSLDVRPGPFRELYWLDDRAPFEPGPEWTPLEVRPWLYIGAGGAHPYGPITLGGEARPERWAVRRWQAPAAGDYVIYVAASPRLEQGSCPLGDGVRVSVWRDERMLAARNVPPLVQGDEPPVAEVWARTALGAGDTVDIAVDARGNDVCDATKTWIRIYEDRPLD